MSRSWRLFLGDMLEASDRVARYSAGSAHRLAASHDRFMPERDGRDRGE